MVKIACFVPVAFELDMIRENSKKSEVLNYIMCYLAFKNAQNYNSNINVISKAILEI